MPGLAAGNETDKYGDDNQQGGRSMSVHRSRVIQPADEVEELPGIVLMLLVLGIAAALVSLLA